MKYKDFFCQITGHQPFPYQQGLVDERPVLLQVPTGLGKTAAVVLMWLYQRFKNPETTPKRLVYCLPMRSLVQQVHSECVAWMAQAQALFAEKEQNAPDVFLLMGGFMEERWERCPEEPAILVGTQDMLLSRALNRGYSMSRFRWPISFGFLNNDAFWVFDEPQLMGVAVETSAQLQAFREWYGTSFPTRSLWMSATLDTQQLATFDQAMEPGLWPVSGLSEDDKKHPVVVRRIHAKKQIHPVALAKLSKKADSAPLASMIAERHVKGTLTLVVINQVKRAREVFEALREHLAVGKKKDRRYPEHVILLHSRFRPHERRIVSQRLLEAASQGEELIVVATQVVEAGLHIDAQTLITELCPWPSFVQRLGRCNRAGVRDDASVFWIDLDTAKDEYAAPYSSAALEQARGLLLEHGQDGSPSSLSETSERYLAPFEIRPVLRKKDLLQLFDSTPDLLGDDVDVSRFVRDGNDTDIRLFWRDFSLHKGVPDERGAPHRDELCSVSIKACNDFLDVLAKRSLFAWSWDHLEGEWRRVRKAHPGQVLMLAQGSGGYHTTLGWTGSVKDGAVPLVCVQDEIVSWEGMADDQEARRDMPIRLTEHLAHVEAKALEILGLLGISGWMEESVRLAALWHDVGKAHLDGFQVKLVTEGVPEHVYAKSPNIGRGQRGRAYYRHELASALAWHQRNPEHAHRDLVAYLIAAHHGRIRMSIRALPQETGNPDALDAPFARGVWHGDQLLSFAMPDGQILSGVILDLSMVKMGEGSWLERVLRLRDDPDKGPFRLAYAEALLRVADWRASAEEATSQSTPLSRTTAASVTLPTQVVAMPSKEPSSDGAGQLSLLDAWDKGGEV